MKDGIGGWRSVFNVAFDFFFILSSKNIVEMGLDLFDRLMALEWNGLTNRPCGSINRLTRKVRPTIWHVHREILEVALKLSLHFPLAISEFLSISARFLSFLHTPLDIFRYGTA